MDFSLSWERGKMYLSWKYERERERVGKNVQLVFFSHPVKLGEYNGWQHHCHCHLIGPHTNYKLPNQQKCEICYQILYIFRFFSILLYCEICCDCVNLWESARKKRERGKIQFWTSYYKFSNGPDYYKSTFFITITIIFHCCMGLGLQYASENGQPRQAPHPMSGRVRLRCGTLPAASVLQGLGAQFSCKIMVLFCSCTNYMLV